MAAKAEEQNGESLIPQPVGMLFHTLLILITIVGADNDSDTETDKLQALTEDPGSNEEGDADHLEKMTDYKSYSKVI